VFQTTVTGIDVVDSLVYFTLRQQFYIFAFLPFVN